MAEIKSRLMDSCGHMATFHPFNEDQMASITRRFFFTCDVTKLERSIFDRRDMTLL